MILILGAGLAGISASYHIGHDKCLLLEREGHPCGHIRSEHREGFTWDQGPHVSFTKSEYVRNLFEKSVEGGLQDIQVKVANYYQGNWIDHPAQTSLYQVPQPLRDDCLNSFLNTRKNYSSAPIHNYKEWLDEAFGPVFANTFPAIYTEKYWTVPPSHLATNWIGERVLYPDIKDVQEGAKNALERPMHYINNVRYPLRGGYQSFADGMVSGANIRYGAEVISIDLVQKKVWLASGECLSYECLINTLPLPIFINSCQAVPSLVIEAARKLTCTQLLLVNIAAPHQALRPEHWIYVYDQGMLTTRVNIVEKLSPKNAPEGWTGVQAEVYFSRYRPLPDAPELIGEKVEQELIKMGLLNPQNYPSNVLSHRHLKYVPWANVLFDHATEPALEYIWKWLEQFGLARDSMDTSPLTNWAEASEPSGAGTSLFMAGRFGQWKYFWSDDCVLRGKLIAEVLSD